MSSKDNAIERFLKEYNKLCGGIVGQEEQRKMEILDYNADSPKEQIKKDLERMSLFTLEALERGLRAKNR